MSKWFDKCKEIISNMEKDNLEIKNKVKFFSKQVTDDIHGLELVDKDKLLGIINNILLESFGTDYKLFIKNDDSYPSIDFVVEIDELNTLEFEISKGYRRNPGGNVDIHYVNSTNFKLLNKKIVDFDKSVCNYINNEILDVTLSILSKQKFVGKLDTQYKNLALDFIGSSKTVNSYNNYFKTYLPSYNNKKNQMDLFHLKLVNYKKINTALDGVEGVIDSNSKLADFFDELNTDYNYEEETFKWNGYYI